MEIDHLYDDVRDVESSFEGCDARGAVEHDVATIAQFGYNRRVDQPPFLREPFFQPLGARRVKALVREDVGRGAPGVAPSASARRLRCSTARICSAAASGATRRASSVLPAMCGMAMTCGWQTSAGSGRGSSAKTSSAAPAIRPLSSAANSAHSSTEPAAPC